MYLLPGPASGNKTARPVPGSSLPQHPGASNHLGQTWDTAYLLVQPPLCRLAIHWLQQTGWMGILQACPPIPWTRIPRMHMVLSGDGPMEDFVAWSQNEGAKLWQLELSSGMCLPLKFRSTHPPSRAAERGEFFRLARRCPGRVYPGCTWCFPAMGQWKTSSRGVKMKVRSSI